MNSAEALHLLPALSGSRFLSEAEWARIGPKVLAKNIKVLLPVLDLEEGEHRVRDYKMPGLTDGLAKLARRAEKLGLPVPAVSTVRVEEVPTAVAFHWMNERVWAFSGHVQVFHVLKAATDRVVLDGWTFAGTIEHLGEDGNVVRGVPEFEGKLPVSFRTDKPTCDHCKVYRRRASTFIVSNGASFQRVGRQCLADFVGSKNADSIVALAAIEHAFADMLEDDWSEDGGYGGGGELRVDPVTFLSSVALCIQEFGWLSRGAARETDKISTASAAMEVLFPPKRAIMDGTVKLTRDLITDAHRADAASALIWAREIDPETTSDFLHNCRVVAGLASWGHKHNGIGAAILMSYQREQERLKRMEFERRLPSVFLGSVGERFGSGKGKKAVAPIQARVLGVYSIDGQFGLTTIIRMQALSADGVSCHDLVWFCSGTCTGVVDQEALDAERVAGKALDAARAAPSDSYSDAWSAAIDAANTTWWATRTAAEKAIRDIAVGDLVLVTGTVKKQEVSKKTTRPETVLSRCALTLVVEQVESK